MTTERLVGRLTGLVVRYVDPDAVILFGSAAQGRATVHSDVDLLVVGPFREAAERRGLEFREALTEIPVPVDAIFLTPDEYTNQVVRPGSFVETAKRHGRLVYVRPGLEREWASRVSA